MLSFIFALYLYINMFLDWFSFILLFILLDSFPTVVFPLTMTLHPSNDPSFIRPTDRSSALNAFTFVAYCVEFSTCIVKM